MKKKFSLSLLFASLMLLGACSNVNGAGRTNIDFDNLDSNEYSSEKVTGTLGSFDLLSPYNGAEVTSVPTFRWQECTNAKTYTLEICENDRFLSTVDYIVYDKIENLTSTTFDIQADLATKNTTYYWKVTAVNDAGTKVSDSVFTFYLKAQEVEEVNFDLGYADDWLLHSAGSYADISIDNSNFFGNDKPALAVTFKKEDTNQGIPASDGWIIVTKTIEKSCYGTDSIFFNFYYAGNDSRILIRLVDKDNEYWFCEISISNNAKQSVILKFDSFEQRIKDVPVANRHFDFERIKYMEVVFEKTFGDGVCLISDVKAIKFDNYKDRFIDKLHFDEYSNGQWTYENYNFVKNIDGDKLELQFSNTAIGDNTKGINGYGFSKLNVEKFFVDGDAIKVKVKYNGNKGTNIILRVYEEDLDRWAYKIPYSSLTEGEYEEYIIPYMSFASSEVGGDGKRQFSYFHNIQFGVEGQNGTGSITFKDFEVVKIKDYATEESRNVAVDGVIETFDKYTRATEMHFIWGTSTGNKDEFMDLSTTAKAGGPSNIQCGSFSYKTDMEPATYTLPLTVVTNNFSSFSIWLKDASISSIRAKVDLYISLVTGDEFVYTIEQLDQAWYGYSIPFSSFRSTEDSTIDGSAISVGTIVEFKMGIQYFTPSAYGISNPTYTNGNIVYVDNIMFGHESTFEKVEKEKIIRSVDDIAMIEDGESYNTTDDVFENWMITSSIGYEKIELSDDVSSKGGKHSIYMEYYYKNSVSYVAPIKVDSAVGAKGISIDIKSDEKVRIYINIYVQIGTTIFQYRATIDSTSNYWHRHKIGFDNFELQNSTSAKQLISTMVPNIVRVTFGAVDKYSDYHNGYFYIDNYCLVNTSGMSYTTNESYHI